MLCFPIIPWGGRLVKEAGGTKDGLFQGDGEGENLVKKTMSADASKNLCRHGRNCGETLGEKLALFPQMELDPVLDDLRHLLGGKHAADIRGHVHTLTPASNDL